ncbi:hypothetical protein VTK56DRAFT_8656 [Thermocarpiscus australiensis]
MIRRYRDYDYFKARLLPLIEASASSIAFALAAIKRVTRCASEDTFPRLEVLDFRDGHYHLSHWSRSFCRM